MKTFKCIEHNFKEDIYLSAGRLQNTFINFMNYEISKNK